VLRIETESTACVAFCFHPFKPLLTMVDARGVVRVVNYRPLSGDAKHAVDARAITNRFHVARGAPHGYCFASCARHQGAALDIHLMSPLSAPQALHAASCVAVALLSC